MGERKNQLKDAQDRLEKTFGYQRIQSLKEQGARHPEYANAYDSEMSQLEDALKPITSKIESARGLIEKDEKTLRALDDQHERLTEVQTALEGKYNESVSTYDSNIAQVKDLSQALGELRSSIVTQGIYQPGIDAAKSGQSASETAGELLKTNLGRALTGAKRIVDDLFAQKIVSPTDQAALLAVESAIAGKPVDLRTAARMAEVGALNPEAFKNQVLHLNNAMNNMLNGSQNNQQLQAALQKLSGQLEALQKTGSSPCNPLYTVLSTKT